MYGIGNDALGHYFAWSGKEIQVDLCVDEPEDAVIKIDMMSYLPEGLRLGVRVYDNENRYLGHGIAENSDSNVNHIEIALNNVQKKQEQLNQRFIIRFDTWKPCDFNIGTDDRDLGIALTAIAID